jgi:uncharacterized protein YeeX (DUF496 family)
MVAALNAKNAFQGDLSMVDIAPKIVNQNYEWALIHSLDSYSSEDQEEIAKALRDNGKFHLIKQNLDKFNQLSQEFINQNRLIEDMDSFMSKEGDDYVSEISSEEEYNQVANKLKKLGYTWNDGGDLIIRRLEINLLNPLLN